MESTSFEGRDYRTGKPVSINVIGETISAIQEKKKVKSPLWIGPALIDIQINGFGGHGFNEPNTSPESVTQIVQNQWKAGTASILPTITTNSHSRIIRSLKMVARACDNPQISKSILGIHLEGPFISPVNGPRGAHPIEHVRLPDWDEFCRFQDAAEGRICLVTLAPETKGAIPFIEHLVNTDVVVAMGHTNALGPDVDAAVKSGVRLSTHLGAAIKRRPCSEHHR